MAPIRAAGQRLTGRCRSAAHESTIERNRPGGALAANAIVNRVAGDVIGLGAFSYLPKPVRFEYLRHIVASRP